MLLSPCELILQETVSLKFCFDFESKSQGEGNHADVVEDSAWEVAAREASVDLSEDEPVYLNGETYQTR